MTVSWFRSGNSGSNNDNHYNSNESNHSGCSSKKVSMKEAVKALYPPPKFSTWERRAITEDHRSRFSSLLLEHGERHIQDWAVIAYTSPVKAVAGRLPPGSPRKSGKTQWAQATNNNKSLSSSSPSTENTGNSSNYSASKTTGASSSQQQPWQSTSNQTNTPTSKNNTTTPAPTSSGKSSSKQHKKKTHLRIDKDSYPSAHMTKIEGRLHLCSQSIVFEPTDATRGIVRCPFAKMESPPKEYPSSSELLTMTTTAGSFEAMCVEFTSTRHVVMKTQNVIGPYETIPLVTVFRFTFLHSSPASLVDLCQRLFQLLHQADTSRKLQHAVTCPELEELIRPMVERPFDATNLVDIRERPLTSNLRCSLLTPLQNKPGCLVLTPERIYFQPAVGGVSGGGRSSGSKKNKDIMKNNSYSYENHTKAIHWLQTNVQATARRYHGLKDCALEIYWKDQTSVLLAFQRKHEREQVLRLLPSSNVPCHTDRDFVVQASQAWQKGDISNYDYLLVLNSAAGRTFHDLSRYPVFPWVIADYESSKLDLTKPSTFRDLTKPVGALNEDRLAYFKQRYESMHDMEDPFLFGTHYSAAGYVLYYLVRCMPEHMLCLQNGKFDAPDRMFHSVNQCFNSALTNHADVKELIPEFYSASHDFDFLINARSLQLGATQNGDRVNDVYMPPWAKSPRDFIKKNREALESDLCTSVLPRWIDLIFGSKSRGDAAREANNLFHRMAYLGPSDLSAMTSEEERFHAELQATEFGIVPDQLFVAPHPLRHETVDESFVSQDIGRTFSGGEDGVNKGEAWELLDPPSQNSSHESTNNKGGRSSSFGSELDPVDGGAASHVLVEDQNGGPSSDNPGSSSSLPVAEADDGISGSRGNPFGMMPGINSSRDHPNPRVALPLSGSGEGGDRGSGAFSSLGQEPTLSNVSSSSGAIPGALASPRHDSSATTSSSSSAEWDMRILERVRLHEDSVSGCCLMADTGADVSPSDSRRSIVATTSLDGGLKVHTVSMGTSEFDDQQKRGLTGTLSRFSYITMSRGQVTPSSQTKLTEFRSHTASDPLACLAVANDGYGGQIAFAGGHDDVVLAYGINSACAVASVYSHRDAVTGLDLLPRPSTPLRSASRASEPTSALWLEHSTHIMVSGSWDATVKVWSVTVANGETVSINREPLGELFDAESSIVCVSVEAVPGGGIVIGAGCADGSFCVWNLHNDGVKVVIHKEPARRGSGPCSVVKWSSTAGQLTLFTGFATGKVASYSLVDGSMRKASVVSVGVAVQCLVYSENILLVGCADGGLRLIPVRGGAYFASNPTLWAAVNNKSSPGLSSISVAYFGNASDGSGRCMCCTGADDGSIALFELKKVK